MLSSIRITRSIFRPGRLIATAVAVAAAGFTAGSAQAGFSNFKMAPRTESGIQRIIEHTYGGDWAPASSGKDYIGPGGMTAVRVNDNFGLHALDLTTGDLAGASDATFTGGTFTARAVAKFSLNMQTFGYNDSGGFHSLFTADGLGFDVTSTTANVDSASGPIRFERSGDSGTQTTWHGDNLDGRDHMLTYRIDGVSGADGPVFLLFWEDLDKTASLPVWRSSSDFNDLVVELRGGSHISPGPLPGDGGNGGGGGGGGDGGGGSGGVAAAPLPAPGVAGVITLGGVLSAFGIKRGTKRGIKHGRRMIA
jgi:hypothetical protein